MAARSFMYPLNLELCTQQMPTDITSQKSDRVFSQIWPSNKKGESLPTAREGNVFRSVCQSLCSRELEDVTSCLWSHGPLQGVCGPSYGQSWYRGAVLTRWGVVCPRRGWDHPEGCMVCLGVVVFPMAPNPTLPPTLPYPLPSLPILWTETPGKNMGTDRKWHHTPHGKSMRPDRKWPYTPPWHWHLVAATAAVSIYWNAFLFYRYLLNLTPGIL